MFPSNSRPVSLPIEILRRIGPLILFIAAAVLGLGYGQSLIALACVIAGLALYIFLPLPRLPTDTVHHQRLPAVIVPDLLGFMLGTVFFALPLVVAAQEPWRNGPWELFLLTGVPALVSLLILLVALRHQCQWLRPTGHDLTFADFGRTETIDFHDIASIATRAASMWPGRTGLALIVTLRDGARRTVPAGALAGDDRVLAALLRGGVTLDAPLADMAHKAAHRMSHHRTHAAHGAGNREKSA